MFLASLDAPLHLGDETAPDVTGGARHILVRGVFPRPLRALRDLAGCTVRERVGRAHRNDDDGADAEEEEDDHQGAEPRLAVPHSWFHRVSVTLVSQEEMLPQTPPHVGEAGHTPGLGRPSFARILPLPHRVATSPEEARVRLADRITRSGDRTRASGP